MDAPPIQYARTQDGVNIAYWIAGSGPTLLLLAAIQSHVEREFAVPEMAVFYERLTEQFQVIRFDHRGRGMSGGQVEPVWKPNALPDIEAVLAATNTQSFGVVSPLGPTAATAIRCLLDLDARGAVLWNPSSGPSRPLAVVFEALAEFPGLAAETIGFWRGYRSEASLAAYIDLGSDDDRAIQRGLEGAEAQRVWDADLAPRLDAVHVPVHIAYTRESPLSYGAFAQDLAALIPGARLSSVADTRSDIYFVPDEALRIIEQTFPRDPAPARVSPGGFRTLLFTDLESSTALTQSLGDAKAQEILSGHNEAVREALEAHDGEEVKHTGDGIFAAFRSAVSAVEAALQIQRELAGGEVRVRIGLNAGEPIAEDDDYFGAAVQLAARVCDRAEPGQVLVSNVVKELCTGKLFQFADQGEATLKGFPEPVRLFVVRERE